MNKLRSILATAVVAAIACAPALAQEAATPPVLQVDQGTVMVSHGGEFATAASGAVIAPGSRLMVTEGSAATLVYSNQCTRHYDKPGVVLVEGDCKRAAVGGVQNSTVATAVAVGMIAVPIVDSLLDNDDDDSNELPPPVSR